MSRLLLHPMIGGANSQAAQSLCKSNLVDPLFHSLARKYTLQRHHCKRYSIGENQNGPMISEQRDANGPSVLLPLMPGNSMWYLCLENQHRPARIIPSRRPKFDLSNCWAPSCEREMHIACPYERDISIYWFLNETQLHSYFCSARSQFTMFHQSLIQSALLLQCFT